MFATAFTYTHHGRRRLPYTLLLPTVYTPRTPTHTRTHACTHSTHCPHLYTRTPHTLHRTHTTTHTAVRTRTLHTFRCYGSPHRHTTRTLAAALPTFVAALHTSTPHLPRLPRCVLRLPPTRTTRNAAFRALDMAATHSFTHFLHSAAHLRMITHRAHAGAPHFTAFVARSGGFVRVPIHLLPHCHARPANIISRFVCRIAGRCPRWICDRTRGLCTFGR